MNKKPTILVGESNIGKDVLDKLYRPRSTIIITIYGDVSSGKTSLAQELRSRIIDRNWTVHYNDHRLFSFDKQFKKKYRDSVNEAKKENPDFGLIVVGTGCPRGKTNPFKIVISETISNDPIKVLNLFLDHSHQHPEGRN